MSITKGSSHILFSRIGLSALLLLFFVPISGSLFNIDADSAQAAIAWSTNSSGIGNGFTWSGGQTDKNLFGNPTTVPTTMESTFGFEPVNFIANATDGKSALTTDRLQFDILADNAIQSINIAESGSYSITGTGTVTATGFIKILNLDGNQVISKTFTTTCNDGTWSGSCLVDNINLSHIRIILTDMLIAKSSGPGLPTWIQKDALSANNGVGIQIITTPEPATIGILTMGSLVVSIFGRKKW